MSELASGGNAGLESELLSGISAVAVTHYSGPLPPPEILERLESLYPGAAKLIIDDVLIESAKRRENETRILPHFLFRQTLGAISASALGIIGVSGGIWLAHEGRSMIGLGSVLGTLATLLAVFLSQSRKID